MSKWRRYPTDRALADVPVKMRVVSPCGRYIATYYLVSENEDDESEGGLTEIAVNGTSDQKTLFIVERAWDNNYRTHYFDGFRVESLSFSEDGNSLLINGGGTEPSVRIPFNEVFELFDRFEREGYSGPKPLITDPQYLAFRFVKTNITSSVDEDDLRTLACRRFPRSTPDS